MRRRYLVVVLVGAIGVTFFAACNDVSQSDHNTCDVDDFAALAPNPSACSNCLGANCCDLYGTNEATEGGAALAKQEYKCLLEAGAVESPAACISGEEPPATQKLLTCAGTYCANECQLGSVACTPTPDAPQILTPSCDTCVSGSCCSALNTCYASRECALAFQCILACTANTGASALQSVFADPSLPSYLSCAQPLACGSTGDLSSCGQPENSRCFADCVEEYSPPRDAGLPQMTECLSITLFSCAANTCITSCAGSPATNDAGSD